MSLSFDTFMQPLATIPLTAGTWVFINWVWQPWAEFLQLRKTVQQKIFLFLKQGLMDSGLRRMDITTPEDELKQLGAQLLAVPEGFFWWHKKLTHLRKYDIYSASYALIRLAECHDYEIKVALQYEIRGYLRLAQSLPYETFEQICIKHQYFSPLIKNKKVINEAPVEETA